MDSEAKQAKTQQVRDILRLRLIEEYTYAKITEQTGASRPMARKYIDKFLELVSDEDLAIKDSYKSLKRRVPFPVCWNKYVKIMLADYSHHPKPVATNKMKKKIIETATRNNYTVYKIFCDLEKELKDKCPSYETVACILREHRRE